MKILIVNGYKDNPEGLKAFLGFRYLIQKILMEQTIVMDMESEFVIRRMEDLDDILFESTSSNNKISSGRNFDSFDMIFITGEPQYRPWSKLTVHVQILVRMCLRARKFLFASSFAMETLVFQAATNFDRSVTIINGDEGGNISEMPGYTQKNSSLASQDYFLDNTTGDLYIYRNDQQEWSTKTNTGLHNSHAVKAHSAIGKFIIKAPVYRSNKVVNEMSASSGGLGFISKRTEVRCYVKTQYSLHWAFQGMTGSSFIAQKRSKWDVHPFSFMIKETSFVTLAESDYGPLIIQFDDFILGCQFEIVPKYFESIIPLKNFVYNKLHLISENKQSKLSIISVVANTSSIALAREIMGSNGLIHKQNHHNTDRITPDHSLSSKLLMGVHEDSEQKRIFRNSGLAASKKNIGILVSENAVSTNNRIKVKSRRQSVVNLKNGSTFSGGAEQGASASAGGSNNLFSFEDILAARLKELGLDDNDQDQVDQEAEPITQGQVRRMLHPFLNKESFQETGKNWISGMIKAYDWKSVIRVKQKEMYKGPYHKQIVREEGGLSRSQSVINLRRTSQTQIRLGEITKIPSIFINEPYKSQEEQRRDFERKENSKNIGPMKLDFSISKSKIHSTLDPSVSGHTQRDSSKPSMFRYENRSRRPLSQINI